jgi:uncharacterized damage-inducible protein DinB
MEAPQAETTIYHALPWVKVFLDYTDAVVQGLPDDSAAIRPVDPKDAFVFSAKEQAMHVADVRWDVLEWITGADHSQRRFAGDYPGKDKPWVFKEATRERILASLLDSRQQLDVLFSGPAAGLDASTPALIKAYEKRLDAMRTAGKDTAEAQANGPSTLGNMLLFLTTHEAGHRAVLQHMLRLHGVEVTRLA